MKRRILLYYPSNKRASTLEVLCEQLIKRGNEVLMLTTCEAGTLHQDMEKAGVKTFTHAVPKKSFLTYYPRQIAYLIRFCREQKIDFIFSHLQHTNVIAVLAQHFLKARLIVFRHHFKFSTYSKNSGLEKNQNEARFDLIINRLARKIVVPSSGVYNGMKDFESVDMRKVEVIHYMYDFSKYGKPEPGNLAKIKAELNCRLVLIMVSRLIPFKRHDLVFAIVKKLVAEGLDIKMLVLDEGQEKEKLETYIRENRLEKHILMLGFRKDFLEYMAAADLLVHPSLTEASNSVCKEMGLLEKAVAVCQGVGDFSDYITDGVNGFLLPIDHTEVAIEALIRKSYADPSSLKQVGRQLRKDVLERFSVREDTVDKYISLLQDDRMAKND